MSEDKIFQKILTVILIVSIISFSSELYVFLSKTKELYKISKLCYEALISLLIGEVRILSFYVMKIFNKVTNNLKELTVHRKFHIYF